MRVTWGAQRGDPRELALRIQLVADPDDGRGADPLMAASWGALSLWAGGVNVTAHSDGQETHEAVNWYLLPWLEWIAERWDPIFHEERLPCRVAGDAAAQSLARTAFPPDRAPAEWEAEWQGWWHRHAMQSARAGGPFPDVILRRWRDQLEVSWRSLAPAGVPADVRFLATDGWARSEAEAAAHVVYDVCEEAVTELRRRHPDHERLVALEKRFEALHGAGRAGRLSWLAGLGSRFDELMAALRANAAPVFDLFQPTDGDDLVVGGSCHGTLLFGSMSPAVAAHDVLSIAEQMTRARAGAGASAAMDGHVRSVPLAGRYEVGPQGDDLAADLRSELGLLDNAAPDVDALLASLGITVEEVELSDPGLRGVSFAGEGLAPTVLVNTRSHDHFSATTSRRRRRFTLAHELCHLLYDRDRGAPLAIASGPWAPRDIERRANAFAAGLLMPAEAVAVAVDGNDLYTLDGVRAVADALDASVSATIARLHVLGHIDDDTENWLKDQLGPK